MADAVLDASAVVAFLLGEPGTLVVERFLGRALICVVNEAEVISVLINRGEHPAVAELIAERVPGQRVDVDLALARAAGSLFAITKRAGLSLGDRFCLALARRERLPVVTADRNWAKVDLGVDVRLIR